MSDRRNRLGEYLHARRGLVTPEQVGIPGGGRRRVPGLRREEVAMLAGISADYYLGLERGRDRNPSAQVLESIARVLRLGDEEVAHLLGLASDKPRRTPRKPRRETVPTGIASLVASLPHPAFIEGRYFDVLVSNPMARALSPRLTPGGNQLLDLFLEPAERELYPDWDGTTDCYVSSLRQAIGQDTDDPRFIELVGELTLASTRFRELWNRHDVSVQRGTSYLFDHPQVGRMRLDRERLDISGSAGMHVIVFHAADHSPDADALALLRMSALPSGTT
ncbi:helix-turn-helix transcriptional regulator [Umezawaea endophytica]|uniref:Helix-turn-helix transcriptional regulator n=1 Tax=Umezawaea endophytica TaxID=1654476 RepID=A0A9X2VJY0_9PSEU|nr:helix-turn-helix transcriptional regulator [Umezawaea endophytica]MCS7478025.1 helix-turn-helix transcriptional regulator [Umezawaea endophytica]